MSGVFAALGCKRTMVLSGNHLRFKKNSCVLCRRRDSPYTWYICVLGDHRMSIFFLPGVAVLRFRIYSLLWHAWVLF